MVAGPSRRQSYDQAIPSPEQGRRAGAQFFRETLQDPYFSLLSSGIGQAALQIISPDSRQFGIKIITEAIDNESLELVAEYATSFRSAPATCGISRSLKRAGSARKPVMLKRGMSARSKILIAAEYIINTETTT